MAHIGDTAVRFPISGSGDGVQPVHMRVIRQRNSASLSVVAATSNPRLAVSQNMNRVNMMMVNDSPSFCYIRFGSGSLDSTNYSAILAPIDRGATVRNTSVSVVDLEGVFTGEVYARWETASGSLKITEFFAM